MAGKETPISLEDYALVKKGDYKNPQLNERYKGIAPDTRDKVVHTPAVEQAMKAEVANVAPAIKAVINNRASGNSAETQTLETLGENMDKKLVSAIGSALKAQNVLVPPTFEKDVLSGKATGAAELLAADILRQTWIKIDVAANANDTSKDLQTLDASGKSSGGYIPLETPAGKLAGKTKALPPQ